MKLIRTWYRALLAQDHSLWCESSDPDEVLRASEKKAVILQKHETYEVESGWGKWDGTLP